MCTVFQGFFTANFVTDRPVTGRTSRSGWSRRTRTSSPACGGRSQCSRMTGQRCSSTGIATRRRWTAWWRRPSGWMSSTPCRSSPRPSMATASPHPTPYSGSRSSWRVTRYSLFWQSVWTKNTQDVFFRVKVSPNPGGCNAKVSFCSPFGKKKMTQTLFFWVKICTQPSSGSRLSSRVMLYSLFLWSVWTKVVRNLFFRVKVCWFPLNKCVC